MERELKFRAFNKYGMNETCTFKELTEHNCATDGCGETKWSEGTIIMQYTGLKDKNGKEIYEGDVLEWKGIIVLVKWSQQASAYWMVWKSISENNREINHFQEMNATYGSDIYIIETAEIKGNQFEHPHLLTN